MKATYKQSWISDKRKKRILLVVFGLVSIVVFCFLGLIVYFKITSSLPSILPYPIGPYMVGRTSYEWTDVTRIDPFSDIHEKRKLLIWVWYPAQSVSHPLYLSYFPSMWRKVLNDDVSNISFLVLQQPTSIITHSIESHAISLQKNNYPLVIFAPGMGLNPARYTVYAENLASNGYIVAGIFPTYSTNVVFNDGTTINENSKGNPPESQLTTEKTANKVFSNIASIWSDDMLFVRRQIEKENTNISSMLYAKIDFSRMAYMGHSLGGAAALEGCQRDTMCKASINMDGWLYGFADASINKPALFLGSEVNKNDCNKECMHNMRKIITLYTQGRNHKLLKMSGSSHFNFSDDSVSGTVILKLLGILGPVDGKAFLNETSKDIVSFLQSNL